MPPPATNHTRINQIELTSSRDLYHWERVADRKVFIGIEPFDGENYGCSQLLMAGQPVVRDDGEIWCYYNALRMPGTIEQYKEFGRAKELFRLDVKPEHFEDSGALSLAKLRPDGFVSIDGGECGQILTKPFELKGEDVYINANATWGEIYAEIVDGETRRPHDGLGTRRRTAPFHRRQHEGKDTLEAPPRFGLRETGPSAVLSASGTAILLLDRVDSGSERPSHVGTLLVYPGADGPRSCLRRTNGWTAAICLPLHRKILAFASAPFDTEAL